MSMLAFLLRYFLVPQPGSVQAELRSPRFDIFSTANLLVLLPILFYHAMREKRNTWVLAPGAVSATRNSWEQASFPTYSYWHFMILLLFYIGQMCFVQVYSAQICFIKVRIAHICIVYIGAMKVCSTQICTSQVCLVQMSSSAIGFVQKCTSEIGLVEVRVTKIGPCMIDFADVYDGLRMLFLPSIPDSYSLLE